MSYAKSAAMVVATALTALVAAWTDGRITANEWINVSIAAVTAASIFAGPNVPGARYTKSILAVLGAVLIALTSMISGGISGPEFAQLVVVALGAVGVYAVRNAPATEGRILPPDAGEGEIRWTLVIAAGIVLAGIALGLLNVLVHTHLGIG